MNCKYVCFIILFLLIPSASRSCPTCIGKITQESPPFFWDETYEVQEENEDNKIYEGNQ